MRRRLLAKPKRTFPLAASAKTLLIMCCCRHRDTEPASFVVAASGIAQGASAHSHSNMLHVFIVADSLARLAATTREIKLMMATTTAVVVAIAITTCTTLNMRTMTLLMLTTTTTTTTMAMQAAMPRRRRRRWRCKRRRHDACRYDASGDATMLADNETDAGVD